MRFAAILMSAAMGADLIVGGTAWAASDPRGVWIDDKGRGGVEIKDCGAKLCGHIVGARDEADSNKGCGKQIIGDVVPQGGGLWDNGWIYDPESDKKYDVELKRARRHPAVRERLCRGEILFPFDDLDAGPGRH